MKLKVLPMLVPRVKKAVKKEKWGDAAFKVMNDHDYFFLHFEYDEEKEHLSIELKHRLGLEPIKES